MVKFRKIPGTSLNLSEVGFRLPPLLERRTSARGDAGIRHLLCYALDRGINFFDAAGNGSPAERETFLGNAFFLERDRVFFATGFDAPAFSVKALKDRCEQSLKRLRSGHIDLYQIEISSPKLLEQDELFGCLAKLGKEGKVLTWGISLKASLDLVPEVKFLVRFRKVPCFQIAFQAGKWEGYQAFAEEIGGTPTRFLVALPEINGALPGRAGITSGQAAAKYILSHPSVITVLPEIFDEGQINEFSAVSECPELSSENVVAPRLKVL